MTTKKLSATVDTELLDEVREHVGPRGLSAFVETALSHELERVALRKFLDELSLTIGLPDEMMVAEANVAIDQLLVASRSRPSRASAA